MHPIAAASPTCLSPEEQKNWGSYYDTRPMVVAGRLDEASHIINNNPLLRGMLFLYKNRVDTLANLARNETAHDHMASYAQYSLAA